MKIGDEIYCYDKFWICVGHVRSVNIFIREDGKKWGHGVRLVGFVNSIENDKCLSGGVARWFAEPAVPIVQKYFDDHFKKEKDPSISPNSR